MAEALRDRCGGSEHESGEAWKAKVGRSGKTGEFLQGERDFETKRCQPPGQGGCNGCEATARLSTARGREVRMSS